MVPLDLADRLSVSVLPPGTADSLHVDGLRPGPAADNLVLRAIAVARRHAAAALGRRSRCRRSLRAWTSGSPSPPGSAAARPTPRRRSTRRSRHGGSTLDAETRRRIAAELGSDVPFFLAGGPALVEGRGERVTPLGWLRDAGANEPAGPRSPGLLVVTPDVGISTPAAFAAFDAGARRSSAAPPGRRRCTWPTSFARAARRRPAGASRRPRRGERPRARGRRSSSPASSRSSARCSGCWRGPVGLSGSGPTHWALYPSVDEAAEAADARARGVRGRAATDARAAGRRSSPRPGSSRATSTTQGGNDDPPGDLDHRRAGRLGPYSQAIASDGFVFCSGQIGIDPASGELADGIEAQTDRALRNLAAVLDAAGLGSRTS